MTILKKLRLLFIGTFVVLIAYYCFPQGKFPATVTIDNILVLKSKRQLLAYSNGQLIKTYKISLGRNPKRQKEYEGDKKTPEGKYTINEKNSKSDFYKNLGISYPNQADIERARKMKQPTGGSIKIHGLKNGFAFIGKFQRWIDWTAGCIALTNEEIDELYEHTPIGTQIEIKP